MKQVDIFHLDQVSFNRLRTIYNYRLGVPQEIEVASYTLRIDPEEGMIYRDYYGGSKEGKLRICWNKTTDESGNIQKGRVIYIEPEVWEYFSKDRQNWVLEIHKTESGNQLVFDHSKRVAWYESPFGVFLQGVPPLKEVRWARRDWGKKDKYANRPTREILHFQTVLNQMRNGWRELDPYLNQSLCDIYAGRQVEGIYEHTCGLDGTSDYRGTHPHQIMITFERHNSWLKRFPDYKTRQYGRNKASQDLWARDGKNRFIVYFNPEGTVRCITGDMAYQDNFGSGTIHSCHWGILNPPSLKELAKRRSN